MNPSFDLANGTDASGPANSSRHASPALRPTKELESQVPSVTPGHEPSSSIASTSVAHSTVTSPLQSVLSLLDVSHGGDHVHSSLELPPEVAGADLYIAPDGSFVEVSSGEAARVLKKRYDQYMGVGKDVRSPYAITAFINQHGRQMYRVGLRGLSAPAASAEAAEDLSSKRYTGMHDPRQSMQQTKRRSRMSVHSFLPSAVFKNGAAPPHPPLPHPDGTRSPPLRKLRKTRSIPNQLGSGSERTCQQVLPTSSTGRPHAHSVSSADAFREPPSDVKAKAVQRDMFADVMMWSTSPASPHVSSGPSSSKQSLQHSNDPHGTHSADYIVNPFGPGVSFESPSWRSGFHATSPRALREMQSFESGLTARADQGKEPRDVGTNGDTLESDLERLPSIPLEEEHQHTVLTPRRETMMHSPYSTEVFDVLQTSRGLPSLDRISPIARETTIKLSLRAEESVAPRDDPRFVIWGYVESDDQENVARASIADVSSCSSGVSRRKSLRHKRTTSPPEIVADADSVKEGPTKLLVAATIERWIAQLSSEFNYDELIVFFLTYRTYISPLDLGHLLISRFHWALGETSSSRDEMVRRIVRVRTFTALRHWVTTFFEIDFVPNRELRLLFANWLNSLSRDPIIQTLKDALKIVRQLRKVFQDRKDMHLRRLSMHPGGQPNGSASRVPVLDQAASAGAGYPSGARESIDYEIDLDLDSGLNGKSTFGGNFPSDRHTAGPVELAPLRQPLHLTFMPYGKKNTTTLATPIPSPLLMPMPNSSLSRVLVNTIGRLGRWKRVLNSRATGRSISSACGDVSAFDVEANETGDLLLVRGGVEQYLKLVETQMSQVTLVGSSRSTGDPPSIALTQDTSTAMDGRAPEPSSPPPPYDVNNAQAEPSSQDDALSDTSSIRPVSSLTAFSEHEDVSDPQSVQRAHHLTNDQLEIVSIDDLDLSDLSSDEGISLSPPPGLKKLPRRLPTRRDFEFVRRSATDTVSSMGIQSHYSTMSAESGSSAGVELGSAIHSWQMHALVDSLSDEEEDGDVEAALRRLEGQINEEKQRAKQSKVDRWVQSIQKRHAASRVSADPDNVGSDDEDYGDGGWQSRGISRSNSRSPSRASISSDGRRSTNSMIPITAATSTTPPSEPPSTDESNMPSDPLSNAPAHTKPLAEDAVPLEILQSRVESVAATSNSGSGTPLGHVTSTPALTKSVHPGNMKWHRSFVLDYRVEMLLQHFSMIDRELYVNIHFAELVTPHMVGTPQDTNVLDWSQFLRERARLKAEGRAGRQIGTLAVVRGRFNLVTNFVISEIVLTHPSQRMRLFTKFVRLSWKAYELKSFNMLVALVAGLRSSWVVRAMQQCADRLRIYDKRILDDLNAWTTQTGHFVYIRQALDAMTEPKPTEVDSQDVSAVSTDGQSTRSRATSDSKPSSAPACVPFFGVYLSQLQPYTDLPDLIDPTEPHEPVGIDPVSNTFEPLAHPEVFSTLASLPPSLQLEPLINVHKQRLVASVLKSFVDSQHLAARVQYPVDKKLFQRCLKLRGLDPDTLERALALFSEAR